VDECKPLVVGDETDQEAVVDLINEARR